MVTAIVCASLTSGVLVEPIRAEQTEAQTPEAVQPAPKQLQDVEARQRALKTQMDLIQKTNNLEERQRLLDEHLKTMLIQAQAMSKMSGAIMDPASREALLEQRTQLITSLMDQMIAHYQMQLTCSK
jgi:hypothetical protein